MSVHYRKTGLLQSIVRLIKLLGSNTEPLDSSGTPVIKSAIPHIPASLNRTTESKHQVHNVRNIYAFDFGYISQFEIHCTEQMTSYTELGSFTMLLNMFGPVHKAVYSDIRANGLIAFELR